MAAAHVQYSVTEQPHRHPGDGKHHTTCLIVLALVCVLDACAVKYLFTARSAAVVDATSATTNMINAITRDAERQVTSYDLTIPWSAVHSEHRQAATKLT